MEKFPFCLDFRVSKSEKEPFCYICWAQIFHKLSKKKKNF